jgi:DNA-binding NarL/FixJ family response regulator
MEKSILIIDDEKAQAEGLAKGLKKILPEVSFVPVFEEIAITNAIENRFFSIAVVDLRMDKYNIDGKSIIEKIIEINPFSKIIIVSGFTSEYFPIIKDLMLTGKIIDVQEKSELDVWLPKLAKTIANYYKELDEDPSQINKALLRFYAETKNEPNTFLKGQKFENFIALLFGSLGYKEISKRVKDLSLNEVDLIVRNEIDDSFMNKQGSYLLIECKNKPEAKVGKNDFIVFKSKLENSNGQAKIGFIITSGYISRNTYIEAVRGSISGNKIYFLSNPEIERLINAPDKLYELKKIMDDQVKEN